MRHALLVLFCSLPIVIYSQQNLQLETSGAEIRYAAFSRDGKQIVTSLSSDSIKIFDAGSGQVVQVLPTWFRRTEGYISRITGKRDFILDAQNRIVHVRLELKGDSLMASLEVYDPNKRQTLTRTQIHSKKINPAYVHESAYFLREGFSIGQQNGLIWLTLDGSLFLLDHNIVQKRTYKTAIRSADVLLHSKSVLFATHDSIFIANDFELRHVNALAAAKDAQVNFLNDTTALIGGNDVFALSLKKGAQSNPIYRGTGRVNGMQITSDGTGIVFSGASTTFAQKSFAGTYDWKEQNYTSVFHLPETAGFNAFVHPDGQSLWVIHETGLAQSFSLTSSSTPIPVPQRGHQEHIESISFSKDQRRMVSAGNEGVIIVWDVYTGRVLDRFSTNENLVSNAVFAEDDQDILFEAGEDDWRRIHRNIPSNTLTGLVHDRFYDGKSRAHIGSRKASLRPEAEKISQLREKYRVEQDMPAAVSSKYFVGIISRDYKHYLKVVDLQTNTVRELSLPDNLLSFYFSPLAFFDESTVVVSGKQRSLVFLDLRTDQVVRRLGSTKESLGEVFYGIQRVVFNQASDTMFSVTNQRIIEGWNLRTGERFFDYARYMKGVYQENAVDYQNGHLSLLTQQDNQFTIGAVLELKTGKLKMFSYMDTTFVQFSDNLIVSAFKATGYPSHIKLSPDASKAAVMRVNYIGKGQPKEWEVFIDVWDLKAMKVLRWIKIPDVSYATWAVDWKYGLVAVWDANATDEARQEEWSKSLGKNAPLGGLNTHAGIKIIEIESMKISDVPLTRMKMVRAGNDGLTFVNKDEFWLRDDFRSVMVRYNWRKGKIVDEISRTTSRFEWSIDGTVGDHVVLEDSVMVYTGEPGAFTRASNVRSFSLKGKRENVSWASDGLGITTVAGSPRQTIAVGLDDNSIVLLDGKTLKERLRIAKDEEGHFVWITPEMYYKSDRGSSSSLFFRFQNRSFSLGQFDVYFNRPDKVLAASGFAIEDDLKLMEKAYRKRTLQMKNNQSLSTLLQEMPSITVADLTKLPFQTANGSLTIRAMMKTAANAGHIQVLVNGVPLYANPGLKYTGKEMPIEIPLTFGSNKIRVVGVNEGGIESLPEEFVVEKTTNDKIPNLYVIAVAINQYQNENFNLQYAVKDARDVLRFMSRAKGFGRVVIDSLFNQQVSVVNVTSLKKKLMLTKPEDQVVLFFAGHGVLDENFDFRFGTWGLDMDNPAATAILYDDLERILDGIPARRKLMLVDACHSGEVDKDEIIQVTNDMMSKRSGDNITKRSFTKVHHNVFNAGMIDMRGFELMQDIFYGLGSRTGAQVVVATAGDSYAQESDKWQNGVFTYSMLNGLLTREPDINQDDVVSTDELVSYLKNVVPGRTEGKQKPRFRQENTENHFTLWQY